MLIFMFSVGKMKLMLLLIEKLCDIFMEKFEKVVDLGEY